MLLAAATIEINWLRLAIELLGGLALFLFGIQQMTDSLSAIAGSRMRTLLARMTTNPVKGCLTGAVVTGLTQSSSVTTVLLVGFVSSGLMTMPQSIGVILGANIGSTFTAQIIAFKVTEFALVLVAVGFLLTYAGRGEKLRRVGMIVLGLGLLFVGMNAMADGTRPLREYEPFIEAMREVEAPWLGVLAGAIFTAIVQSSAATAGIVIILVGQGSATLEGGIALVLGANIGTCVTAGLAGIGRPREAKQVALVHVMVNVLGVVGLVWFIQPYADFIRWLTGGDSARQIANAHTIFNVGASMVFLWFASPMAAMVRYVLPSRSIAEEGVHPRFIDEYYLQTPSMALAQARLELVRIGEMVMQMLAGVPGAILRDGESDLRELVRMDDDVDLLYGAVVTYLGRLSTYRLSQEENAESARLLGIATYLENIGDTIETNMANLARSRLDEGVNISEQTRQRLEGLLGRVRESVASALDALADGNEDAALRVIGMKDEVRSLANDLKEYLGERLVAEAPNRLATFRVETDLVEQLVRIHYFAKRIAKLVLGAERDPETATPAA